MKLLTLAFALALAGSIATGAAEAQTKLLIGYTPNAEATPLYVAKEQGIFAKHGIEAELVPIAINSTVPAALLSNSIQIGAITAPVFLQAVDNGLTLAAITGLTVTAKDATGVGIAARADAGIAGPADLVGKTVAAPGIGAVLHVMARRWLMDNGVDPAQVTFVEGTFPAHADLLKAGTVDAVITVDPFLGRILGSGVGVPVVNLLANMPEGETAMFLSTTADWAAANPETLAEFRAALAEAMSFAEANPDPARAAIGTHLKMPPEALAHVPLPKMDPGITTDQIAWWIEVLKQQSMLTTELDTSKLIAN